MRGAIMRFTVRDLFWLITGVAIAFAIVGAFWRREHGNWSRDRMQWSHQRLLLESSKEAETTRADTAENELQAIENRGVKSVIFVPQTIATKIAPGDTVTFTLLPDGNLDYQLVPQSPPDETAP